MELAVDKWIIHLLEHIRILEKQAKPRARDVISGNQRQISGTDHCQRSIASRWGRWRE